PEGGNELAPPLRPSRAHFGGSRKQRLAEHKVRGCHADHSGKYLDGDIGQRLFPAKAAAHDHAERDHRIEMRPDKGRKMMPEPTTAISRKAAPSPSAARRREREYPALM